MSNNDFTISIIAALNKQLSKQQIKKDLKTIDNSLYVRIISKLAITLSRKQLDKDLKKLNNLYLQIGAGIKTDKNAKQKLQTQIRQLQQNLEELQLKVGVKKADSSNVKRSVSTSIKEAQQYAKGNKIRLDVEVRKEKAVNDILYIGKKYSKLFSNVAATQKYENLLASSYSISDEEQLKSVRSQISAFTSELKANGLATESTGAKWRKLIDRAKELFSAATVVSTIFSQVKQSVSTFLQLDTAMTNLYKVQNDITSRDQFSGLLTKWNRLAQNLAVTTESLISSMEAWSKIGFDLDMSEQLAQITAIFEKTAEISNEKATSTLISAAQAFTEIDDLGVDDYVERVEAVGNKINAIGNRYAIDSEGIADGLQNASAALKMAGNDLNETISLITATNKIYQSPEEGSNMLKVASMRLRGQVDALQEMGEDAEGVSADITKIQQQIYELTGNKVNIFEDEDTLKSTYQMILEIGEVFDSLSDRQQADLLETMFGKQRASAGAALLLNYEELEKIKNDSMNAADSMAEEYSKYMESAEAHITVFKEKLTEAYSAFMSGDLIKYMADAGSGILDIVNATDLLKHSILAITALGIGKGITSVGASIAATAKEYGTLGNALQQIKNLPIDEILRKDVLNDVGESTKLLTEKNLKLLLSQSQLNEDDKTAILIKHNLTEEEAKAKLEKMGLIAVTKSQSVANVEETATTFTLGGAVTFLKGKMASLGVTMKAFFLSNPITATLTILTTAFSIFTTITSKVKQSSEKAAEALENAKSAINSIKSDFDTLSSDTDKIKNKYAELAQQVENLGKVNQSRGKLSTEDYEEFLGLSNQLSKLFPQLTRGYDDNGNAILNLSGNVDTIVGSLDNLVSVQQKLAHQEILKNMPDIWAGYMLDTEDYEKNLSDMEKRLRTAIEAISRMGDDKTVSLSLIDEDEFKGQLDYLFREAARQLGYDWKKIRKETVYYSGSGYNTRITGSDIYWDFSSLDDTQFEQFKNQLGILSREYEDAVMFAKSKIDSANSNMASYINTWLSSGSGEWNFSQMNSDMQNVVKDVLINSDWISSIPDDINAGDWKAVSNWLQEKFLFAINNIDSEEINTALVDAFNGNISADALQSIVDKLIETEGFDKNNPLIIYLQSKIENRINWENDVKSKVKSEYGDMIADLSDDELQIAAKIEVPEGTLLSWDELITKIREVQDSISNNQSPVSFSDIFAIEDAESNLNALGELTEQLDEIQSAYSNLKNVMDNYASTGYITIDQFQEIVEQGAKFLDYLTLEDGQLGVNENAMYELAKARIVEMKAQMVQSVIDNISKIETEADADLYLASTNYDLADSYHTLAEAQLSAWSTSALEKGLSQDYVDKVTHKAKTDIDKINALISKIDFKNFSDPASSSSTKQEETDWKNVLDKETDLLEKQLAANVITFKEYTDKRRQIIEDYYRDGRIKAEDYYDALEDMYDHQLSLYDRVVNAVTDRIDDEIDKLKDQKEEIEKSYQVKIDAIQEEIDALNKANDARQKQIDLEKAQYEAERARNQRVNKVKYMPLSAVMRSVKSNYIG